MLVRCAACAAGVGIVFAYAIARAAPPDRPAGVRLDLPACDSLPFDSKQLVELVRVELEAVGIYELSLASDSTSSSVAGNVATVRLGVRGCDAGADEVELALYNDRSGRHTERTMRLTDLPAELRARAIAIRVVELLRGTWPELAASSAQAPLPSPPASSAPAPAAGPPLATNPPPPRDLARATTPARTAASDRGPMSVEGALSGVGFPSRSTGVLGPRITAVLDWRFLRFSAGAGALFGEATVSSGSADLGWASGHLAVGLRGAAAFVEPRLFLGYGWASGNSADALVHDSSHGGFVAAVSLAGGVRPPLSRHLALVTEVEVGHTLSGVSFLADGDRIAGISGVMLGATVGVAFRP